MHIFCTLCVPDNIEANWGGKSFVLDYLLWILAINCHNVIVETHAPDEVSVIDFTTFKKNGLWKGTWKRHCVVCYDVLITVKAIFTIAWWIGLSIMPDSLKIEAFRWNHFWILCWDAARTSQWWHCNCTKVMWFNIWMWHYQNQPPFWIKISKPAVMAFAKLARS